MMRPAAELSDNGTRCDGACGRLNLFAGEPLISWRKQNKDLCHRCADFFKHRKSTGWSSDHQKASSNGIVSLTTISEDAFGWTPFHWACFVGNDQIGDSSRNDILRADQLGQNALMLACRSGSLSTVMKLSASVHHEDWCIQDHLGRNTLAHSCNGGSASVTEFLLNLRLFDGRLDSPDDTGFTYLQGAILLGNFELTKLLVEAGCNVNAPSDEGLSALLLAVQGIDGPLGATEIFTELLLKYGADPDLRTASGMTPLLIASYAGNVALATLLVNNKADLHSCDNDGCNALYFASKSPMEQNEDEYCPEGVIKEKEYTGMIEFLYSHGVNINQCDEEGVTPLLLACEEGNEEVVETLLRLGADPKVANSVNGFSALHYAAQNENCDGQFIRLLLKCGADVNAVTKEEKLTPLHLSALLCSIEVVKALVENGANVNALDTDGDTALHNCAGKHNGTDRAEIVEYLLENGAEFINKGNANGFTPLAAAAAAENRQVAAILIKRGAEKLSVTPWIENKKRKL